MCDKTDMTVQRLRKLIDDTGLARQDIANEIGCDVSTITKHYNGTRNITTDFIVMYAKYFKVSTDYLLGMTDAKTTDKDRRYITDVTGLSDDAITELQRMKEFWVDYNNEDHYSKIVEFMNSYIESGYFQKLLWRYCDYYENVHHTLGQLMKCVEKCNEYRVKQSENNQYIMLYPDDYEEVDKKMKLTLFDLQENPKDYIKKELREELDHIDTCIEQIDDYNYNATWSEQ